MRLARVCASLVVIGLTGIALAQTESATITGRVSDTTGAAVPGAEVTIHSIERGTESSATTNSAGVYLLSSVQPGQYRMTVTRPGFRQIDYLGLIVNVQDRIEENFRLQVGSVNESITVNGSTPLLDTQDASVSTVVDRNFADNLPLNGRSFQSLIYVTPGVVATAGGGADSGQFSVNGQRASSNYWTVDGVSANAGSNSTGGLGGNQMAGAVGATSVAGGTNGLVSIDAMQEFRIQTSTFAPEYGRTPGAQISIVTRSGTNKFHGSAFDYLRNDKLDANNWFNGYTNTTPLPKAEERQNDFGGTLGGPIVKNRIFFFFSYEGLRLRLPTTVLSTVPDFATRQSAMPATQPILNAFPLPNGPEDLLNPGAAQFNASFSNPSTLDNYSIRLDHKVTGKLQLFGRYNNAPSSAGQRGFGTDALSANFLPRTDFQQVTVGTAYAVSSRMFNDVRFNYTRTHGSSKWQLDDFGGAVPISNYPFPSGFTFSNAIATIQIGGLQSGFLDMGQVGALLQRQINVVDNFSMQLGSHSLKFGVDYRRLTPVNTQSVYGQFIIFENSNSAAMGSPLASVLNTDAGATFVFNNISAFAQDTWRISPRLTATYGLRWDTDLAPTTASGPAFPAIIGVTSATDLSNLQLAPPGTPAFQNRYTNFAPRFGVAYQLHQVKDWENIIKGGFGMFYDLATSETSNALLQSGYPFNAFQINFPGTTFPLSPTEAAPPVIAPPSPTTPSNIAGYLPNFKLPYTLQWNAGFQQALGSEQSLSITYVGSTGRRLIQTASTSGSVNPSVTSAYILTNRATSDYHALQAQLQRRVVTNLQLLAGYTWSHSIDSASAGSNSSFSNLVSGSDPNRASSDFDIRHVFSAGLTYNIPGIGVAAPLRWMSRGWSLQSIFQAQTARPVDVVDSTFRELSAGLQASVRPDLVLGIPLYLYGSQYPGGNSINGTRIQQACPDGSDRIGPFCRPPTDSNNPSAPLRQGTVSRNAFRGFGLFQWDLGVHRDFAVHEALRLQFRAEMFNVLNHPNFAPPVGDIEQPNFGLAPTMLGQYLAGGRTGAVGTGGFSALYQVGGPRSIQVALKLMF